MFCAPSLERMRGCRSAELPVMLYPQFKGAQPIYVFIVFVGRLSERSAAPVV